MSAEQGFDIPFDFLSRENLAQAQEDRSTLFVIEDDELTAGRSGHVEVVSHAQEVLIEDHWFESALQCDYYGHAITFWSELGLKRGQSNILSQTAQHSIVCVSPSSCV